ncbi:hypothetical protein [Brevundimonas aurantiaca]|uniref:hypothetical protein n=1 Tax=Brevundimonas aurantiaca TaxID=74316 RepID=UPI00174D7928|nr:hypothetical protein [Brevundimonas aurantiaca]
MRSNDNLKAEYILIQGQYEAFDQRALGLKALATPLLGAGIAVGVKEGSVVILAATIAVAICLWVLEAIWKAFQYCFTDRIQALEAWFREDGPDDMAPFQIFAAWGQLWHRHYRSPNAWLRIMAQPFVCLPYAVIVVAGLTATGSLAFRH